MGTSLNDNADHCHHKMFGLGHHRNSSNSGNCHYYRYYYYYHVKMSRTLAGSLMSTNQNGGFLVVSESQLCVSLLSQLYPTPPPSFRFDYFFTQPSS